MVPRWEGGRNSLRRGMKELSGLIGIVYALFRVVGTQGVHNCQNSLNCRLKVCVYSTVYKTYLSKKEKTMNSASCDLQILNTLSSLFFLGCVTLGKLLKLSGPQFPPLSSQLQPHRAVLKMKQVNTCVSGKCSIKPQLLLCLLSLLYFQPVRKSASKTLLKTSLMG